MTRDLALELDETLAVRLSCSKQLKQALSCYLLAPVVQVIASYAQPQLLDFGTPAIASGYERRGAAHSRCGPRVGVEHQGDAAVES
jgi:hypothetical protein